MSPNARTFCSFLYYFAEAIVEAWGSKIGWYVYTYISTGSNGNFGGKTGRIYLTAGYVSFWKIVSVSHTKFERNIVKTRPKIEMLKNSREVSMIILVDIECIIYSWYFDCRVFNFMNNRARESRFFVIYSMPKLSKAFFRIASHFWTNIEYPHRFQPQFL